MIPPHLNLTGQNKYYKTQNQNTKTKSENIINQCQNNIAKHQNCSKTNIYKYLEPGDWIRLLDLIVWPINLENKKKRHTHTHWFYNGKICQ